MKAKISNNNLEGGTAAKYNKELPNIQTRPLIVGLSGRDMING
jgi:hypothetical protein